MELSKTLLGQLVMLVVGTAGVTWIASYRLQALPIEHKVSALQDAHALLQTQLDESEVARREVAAKLDGFLSQLEFINKSIGALGGQEGVVRRNLDDVEERTRILAKKLGDVETSDVGEVAAKLDILNRTGGDSAKLLTGVQSVEAGVSDLRSRLAANEATLRSCLTVMELATYQIAHRGAMVATEPKYKDEMLALSTNLKDLKKDIK